MKKRKKKHEICWISPYSIPQMAAKKKMVHNFLRIVSRGWEPPIALTYSQPLHKVYKCVRRPAIAASPFNSKCEFASARPTGAFIIFCFFFCFYNFILHSNYTVLPTPCATRSIHRHRPCACLICINMSMRLPTGRVLVKYILRVVFADARIESMSQLCRRTIRNLCAGWFSPVDRCEKWVCECDSNVSSPHRMHPY